MKIIAMANGGFAIPTLRALQESRHEICAVFAMPLRTARSGKNSKVAAPPIRAAVNDFLSDIPFYDPEDVNSTESIELLRSFNADLIFICDFGRILSRDVLKSVKFGGLNLHGSLLPKYRGAAPINRAIQHGEEILGVSVIFIEPTVDSGPIIAVDSYRPKLEDDAIVIEETLAKMGAPLVLNAVNQIESNIVKPFPQSNAEATKAPKIQKEEGKIDWTRSSRDVINQYRAFQPWPRTFSDWHKRSNQDAPIRLILGPFSHVNDSDNYSDTSAISNLSKPGEVVFADKTRFGIRTGDGIIQPLFVQPAGKKNLPVADFLRGYPIHVGDYFD